MQLQRVTLVLAGMVFGVATSAWTQQDTSAKSITPAMVAHGDSIFHGQTAGGTCSVCHGANAKGMPGLAPDLTSGTWLNSDGSFRALIQTIEQGVPKPKQAAAPMPPAGGAPLKPADIRAVAAYVYSLSHPHR